MATSIGISKYDILSLITAFIIYGNGGIIFINGLIVEEFMQDYQAGETITTWVASIQVALCIGSGFLSSALVELYGSRIVTIVGTVMASLGFVLTAFIRHVGLLFLTYSLLTGIGLGLQFVPTLIVPQFVFTKRRELAIAFILTGSSTSTFVLPVIFNLFREEYGYRGALLLWAGIMLNSVPLAVLMTMHPQLTHREQPAESEASPALEDHAKKTNYDKNVDRQDKPHDKNNSTKHKTGVSFNSLKESSDDKGGSTENGMDHNNSAIHKDGSEEGVGYLPKQCDQKNSTRMLSAHSQLSIGSSVDKDIEKLPLPHSFVGELRRTMTEMREGILELRGGSCRVLISVVFFLCCGYLMPYFFIPAKALEQGLSKAQAAWLVAAIGMSETVWRLAAGFISFMLKKQIVIFHGVAIIVCGASSIATIFVTSFNGFLVVSILYGAGLGSYMCTYIPAAIAFIGISKIVRMLGLISLAWGIAYLISPSIGASVYEATGNVDVPFYMGSCLQLLAAVILFSYRLSPMYQTRPGALEDALHEDLEVGSPGIRPDDVTLASSHRSLASLASTLKHGTHLDVMWRGSGSWLGSTHSRIYANGSTSINLSSASLH